MTSTSAARTPGRRHPLAAAAAIAGALVLGWSVPAMAASALPRLPSVAPSLDLGVWVIIDPDDDTPTDLIACLEAGRVHPVQRRAEGGLALGRGRAGAARGA